jgi:general secretion pathway protein A
MYTRFFGLSRLPFEASPDPGFLFDGPAHREAIASIEYAVATRMGFIMLTGEVGLGKTTVIRAFLDRFDRGRLLPIYVFHPLLSFDDLLELVSDELGLTLDRGIGSFNRLRAIQRELIRLYDEKRQVILVIDEAQRLPEDTLENLRLLTNLETNDAKLLQIVLVGQPELEEVLAQPHLRQLEQRIVLKARLASLGVEDSLRYLQHRLTLAGADDPEKILPLPALRAIVELGGGVPRRMNILANRTLIDAFGADEKPVSAARVRRIAAGNIVEKPPALGRWKWRVAGIAGIVIVIGIVAGLAELWPSGLASFELENARAMLHLSEDGPKTVAMAEDPPAAAPTASVTPQAPAEPAVRPSASPSPAVPQITSTAEAAPVARALPPPAVADKTPTQAAAPAAQPAAAPVFAPIPAKPVPSPDPAPEDAASPAADPLAQLADISGAALRDTPYTVVPGDTLWKICLRAYGPDAAPSMISKVMSRNRIVSDVRLLWGKTIILPASKNS